MISLRSLIIAPLVAVAMLLVPAAAWAHAALVSSDPSAGEVLITEPPSATLVYTEPVAPTALSIVGIGVQPQSLAFTQPDGPQVVVALPPGLANGSYLLSWRVISADGHPVNGTIEFAIGSPSGTIVAPAANAPLDAAIWVAQALQFAALFFGLGSLAFGLVAPVPSTLVRFARGLAVMGLALVPANLALQGLDLLGAGPASLLTAAPWHDAISGTYGAMQIALAIAFVLAMFRARAPLFIAALLGAIAPTLSGHVVTAEPQALMHAVLFAHLASVLFWIGALLPLLTLLRQGDTTGLLRFSRFVPAAIVLLIVSGLTMALVQMGPPGPDWLSPYAQLLAIKLALVAALLLAGLWNRVRLTARAAQGESAPLQRIIVVELILAALIFLVVAGWRFTTPSRVLAEVEAASAPLTARLTAADKVAALTVTPGHPGLVRLDVALPLAAKSVTVQVSNPGAGIATITRPATEVGKDWRVGGLPLPVGGIWHVAVDARLDEFDITTFAGQLIFAPVSQEPQMNKAVPAAIATSVALATSAVQAAPGVTASCEIGQTFVAGPITVSGAFMPATPKSAPTASGYFTITNSGSEPDTLTDASSPAAGAVTLHSMKMNGNVMEMAAVEGGITIAAGGSLTLDTMSYHLMFSGLAAQFTEGQCVAAVLHFAKAGDLPVELNVAGLGQTTPPKASMSEATGSASNAASDMDMSGIDMDGMSAMPGM